MISPLLRVWLKAMSCEDNIIDRKCTALTCFERQIRRCAIPSQGQSFEAELKAGPDTVLAVACKFQNSASLGITKFTNQVDNPFPCHRWQRVPVPVLQSLVMSGGTISE